MARTGTDPPTLDEAVAAVADLVLQFAYRMEYYGKPALYDGGLSALEGAFAVLRSAGCKVNANGSIQESNLLEFSDAIISRIEVQ